MLREDGHDYPALPVALQELDDVPLFKVAGGFDPLAVDLHVAPTDGLGSVAAGFVEADQLQPVVNAVSVHKRI